MKMWSGLCVVLLVSASMAQGDLVFERTRIGTTTFEACSVFDVDKDGHLDIVSGEYWFAGPTFETAHKICDVMPSGDYFDDFADYPMDVNGDGYLDIISGGWFGENLTWRENPKGQPIEWTVREIARIGNVERPCFWDIDGDGHMDIAPNTPGRPQRIFRLTRDEAGNPQGTFEQHTISEVPTGHGLGFGDIDGDGRGDLITFNGWFRAPEDPWRETWEWNPGPVLFLSSSVAILVHDVNGDGLADIIAGNGHDYGLAWWEQRIADDGSREWIRHFIDEDRSQFHEMTLADLDGDGELELITGKRWRAHSGNDPGANDPVGLYYYRIRGGAFERHVIDYGPAETAGGTGIYLWIEDVDGDGRLDIVAPGKEGLYLYRNMGRRDTD
jgi:hypothetical protein